MAGAKGVKAVAVDHRPFGKDREAHEQAIDAGDTVFAPVMKALLLRAVMELHRFAQPDLRFLLFSEIKPAIYERLGFCVLPPEHQHFLPTPAMATGDTPLSATEGEFLKAYF